MRTTRLPLFLSLAVLLAVPGLARAANCYSIYDAKNQLAFQSTVAPVDLSARISQSMRERFPGGHLIMVPDAVDCREYRTGPTLSPRFDAGRATEASAPVMQAPLLRGAGPGVTANENTTPRNPIRSGNDLTIRRP